MGYKTPNIDRIANEGVIFTDYYARAELHGRPRLLHHGPDSVPHRPDEGRYAGCQAGPAGLKTRPSPSLLKNHGYVTAQFGKNHLGDRNEYLPTVHGFDEYSGVLYHLNAEEEPENVDYPKDPEFREKFGPRGVHAQLGH